MISVSTVLSVLFVIAVALIVAGAVTKATKLQNHLVTTGLIFLFAFALLLLAYPSGWLIALGIILLLISGIILFGYTVGVRNNEEA